MKILIAEDDMTSRKFLFRLLARFGDCDLVVDGMEAIDAVLLANKDKRPYDLICLDIMMPKVDGVQVLRSIRDFEKHQESQGAHRSIILMTTALSDAQLVQEAFAQGCDAYAAKPLDTAKMLEVLENFKLI